MEVIKETIFNSGICKLEKSTIEKVAKEHNFRDIPETVHELQVMLNNHYHVVNKSSPTWVNVYEIEEDYE